MDTSLSFDMFDRAYALHRDTVLQERIPPTVLGQTLSDFRACMSPAKALV